MNVGDYVRTKNETLDFQLISKIEKIFNDDFILTSNGYWNTENIIKSSPNIIDLICVGDYVNGKKISDIYVGEDGILRLYDDEYETNCFRNENIKSIVTKEQFSSLEYKI